MWVTAKEIGFKIRMGRYHLRIWKTGFEFGNGMGGRVIQFPWSPYKFKTPDTSTKGTPND